MVQAKFSLSQSQLQFLERFELWGFTDKSALVREALDEMRERLAKVRRAESARLYAEVYAEEEDLRRLTDAALEDWPQ